MSELTIRFDPTAYGPEAAAVLALREEGRRPMPLTFATGGVPEARPYLQGANAHHWFPGAPSPEGALSGLWLYFSYFEESHRISQEIETRDGSFWHGIAHRREPDADNSGYWFRRVGKHRIFPQLQEAAAAILDGANCSGFRLTDTWDPFAFIDFCESSRRRPGSEEERIAMEIQLAEWQLLFDYCARLPK